MINAVSCLGRGAAKLFYHGRVAVIYRKKTIDDVDVAGKRVLVRVDYNVPLKDVETEGGAKQTVVADDSRIVAAMPTIKKLLDERARVVLCSHLGKPKGKYVPELSLAPVAKYLEEMMGSKVYFTPDREVLGKETMKMADGLKEGEVMLLENLRFRPEEEANDDEFSKQLASLCDVYVCDAFGTAHRAHASTNGVTKFAKRAVAGYLIENELKYIGEALSNPVRPFCAVLGGAKVSDKINAIVALLDKVDKLIIGGAMSYTFLAAKGVAIGNSRVEADRIDVANEIMKKAKEKNAEIFLPIDHIISKEMNEEVDCMASIGQEVFEDYMALDIGPKTAELFVKELKECKTVVWNGPMGVFEMDKYSGGTRTIAKTLAEMTDAGAITVVGGGDSAAAVARFGLKDRMTLVSTGGGASLEYIEGKPMPGIMCLEDK